MNSNTHTSQRVHIAAISSDDVHRAVEQNRCHRKHPRTSCLVCSDFPSLIDNCVVRNSRMRRTSVIKSVVTRETDWMEVSKRKMHWICETPGESNKLRGSDGQKDTASSAKRGINGVATACCDLILTICLGPYATLIGYAPPPCIHRIQARYRAYSHRFTGQGRDITSQTYCSPSSKQKPDS